MVKRDSLVEQINNYNLTLLHSEQPKLNRVLAVLSAIGLNFKFGTPEQMAYLDFEQVDFIFHSLSKANYRTANTSDFYHLAHSTAEEQSELGLNCLLCP